jgi:hypothetical protein
MCYDYQKDAGITCRTRDASEACWGAAKRGYCHILDALLNSFQLNSTQVSHAAGSCVNMKQVWLLTAESTSCLC